MEMELPELTEAQKNYKELIHRGFDVLEKVDTYWGLYDTKRSWDIPSPDVDLVDEVHQVLVGMMSMHKEVFPDRDVPLKWDVEPSNKETEATPDE